MNIPKTANVQRQSANVKRRAPCHAALVCACLLTLTLGAHAGRTPRACAQARQQVSARVRQALLAQLLKDRADLVECLAQEGAGRKAEYLANVSVAAVDLN